MVDQIFVDLGRYVSLSALETAISRVAVETLSFPYPNTSCGIARPAIKIDRSYRTKPQSTVTVKLGEKLPEPVVRGESTLEKITLEIGTEVGPDSDIEPRMRLSAKSDGRKYNSGEPTTTNRLFIHPYNMSEDNLNNFLASLFSVVAKL